MVSCSKVVLRCSVVFFCLATVAPLAGAVSTFAGDTDLEGQKRPAFVAPDLGALPKATVKASKRYRRVEMPGEELGLAAMRLATDLSWNDDLGEALAQARVLDRPLLWIRALGELDGFL